MLQMPRQNLNDHFLSLLTRFSEIVRLFNNINHINYFVNYKRTNFKVHIRTRNTVYHLPQERRKSYNHFKGLH